MTASLNTKRVDGRRKKRFENIDALLAEVEAMAAWKGGARSLGNWSPGQNLAHLALTMDRSIDGFPGRLAWPVRMAAKWVKWSALNKPMSPGFKAPRSAGLSPAEVSFEEGHRQMREALLRQKRESKRAESPIFGKMTAAEWEKFHCRHAELHLSFVVPAE